MAEPRNALITGAAKRLGRAIALDLARHGWNIAIHHNASEREALLFAAKNPLDPAHMVLVVAGNDALRTVKAFRAEAAAPYAIFEDVPESSSGPRTRFAK